MNIKWEDRTCDNCKIRMGCPHSLLADEFAIEVPEFMRKIYMKEHCSNNTVGYFEE